MTIERQSIVELIGNLDLEISTAATGSQAMETIAPKRF